MVVDEHGNHDPRDESPEASQRWRDRIQKALWDCFGMTAELFNRTYHGPELRRWWADPNRPKTTPAGAAAVMLRWYTSRTWEPFPEPGPEAAAWWARTIAEFDAPGRRVVVSSRLHEADLAGHVLAGTAGKFAPLVLPPDMAPTAPADPGPMEL